MEQVTNLGGNIRQKIDPTSVLPIKVRQFVEFCDKNKLVYELVYGPSNVVDSYRFESYNENIPSRTYMTFYVVHGASGKSVVRGLGVSTTLEGGEISLRKEATLRGAKALWVEFAGRK